MTRTVVLASGGIDSSTLLLLLLDQGHEVFPLFVDFGQTPVEAEWQALQWIMPQGAPHPPHRLDLSPMKTITRRYWADTDRRAEDVRYETEASIEFLPHRNNLLITAAAIYAHEVSARRIAVGLIGPGDPYLYPDASPEFLAQQEVLLQFCDKQIQVHAPFIRRSKSEVLREGLALGLEWQMTFSCDVHPKHHCSKCLSCQDRELALEELGLI